MTPVVPRFVRQSVNSLLGLIQKGAARRSKLRRRYDAGLPVACCAEVLEVRALLSAPAFGSGFDVQFQSNGSPAGAGGGAIAKDATGNAYVAGTFQGAGDMDPGPGVHLIDTHQAAGVYNGFFAKYDASGNFAWVTPLNTTGGRTQARDIAIGPVSGDVYVTGGLAGTTSLPTVGGTILTVTAPGGNTGFVARLDHNTGAVVWLQAFTNSTGGALGTHIGVDASENVYFQGLLSNTATTPKNATLVYAYGPGNGGVGVTVSDPTVSAVDYFVKLDSNGNALWSGQFSANNGPSWNTNTLYGGRISVDAGGNVYYTGGLTGTVDVDPSSGTTTLTSTLNHSIIIEKLDTNGHLLWVKQNAAGNDQWGNAITVDHAGNVDVGFVGVYKNGTRKNSPTGNVAQFDSAGNLKWLITASSELQYNSDFAVDNANNLYLNRSAGGILKYSPAGILIWSAAMDVVPQAIAIDSAGNIGWTAGASNSTGQVNVSPGPTPIYLPVFNGIGSFMLVEWTQPGGFAPSRQTGTIQPLSSSLPLPSSLIVTPSISPSAPAQPVLFVGDIPVTVPLPVNPNDETALLVWYENGGGLRLMM